MIKNKWENIMNINYVHTFERPENAVDRGNLKVNVIDRRTKRPVMNARVARQAMRLAAEVGIPVFAHCEDKNLVEKVFEATLNLLNERYKVELTEDINIAI